uniref:MICOS complex subunit MIC13 n=1 Tax=Parastrongyloides trichosuri TaxID=131310 RepID=A0A0N4ZN00_PARTI
MSLAKFLIKGTLKVGVLGYTIKTLYDIGVFSTDTKKTEKMFKQLITDILPGTLEVKKQIPIAKEGVIEESNRIVDGTFTAINYFPATFSNFVQSMYTFNLLDEKTKK